MRAADAGCSTNRRTRTRARWTAFKGPWHTPFGWNTFVVKRTFGGLSGYWSQKVMRKLNIPPSHGVSDGPKIVAAHTKMFSSLSGAALAPCQCKPRASALLCIRGLRRKPQLQGENSWGWVAGGGARTPVAPAALTSGASFCISRRSLMRRSVAAFWFAIEPPPDRASAANFVEHYAPLARFGAPAPRDCTGPLHPPVAGTSAGACPARTPATRLRAQSPQDQTTSTELLELLAVLYGFGTVITQPSSCVKSKKSKNQPTLHDPIL